MRNLSLVYLKLLKFDESDSICSSILHIEQDDCRILLRRAEARIGLGMLEEGLSDLNTARELAKANREKEVNSLIKQQLIQLDIERNKAKYWKIH